MRDPRILILQWAGGVFLFLAGTLMLIEPQGFRGPGYSVVQPHLPGWGALFVATGGGLVWTAAVAPRRWAVIAIHLMASVAFGLLVWGFVPTRLWRAAAAYGTLGVGVLVAPFLPGRAAAASAPGRPRPDLFSVVIGVAQIAIGLTLALLPDQPHLEQIDARLGFAALMLLGGAALLVAQFAPALPPPLVATIHLLSGGVLVAWMLVASWPRRAWTGVLLYGGFGLLVAAVPRLASRLRRSRPDSLRTQLGLALAAVAALPLVALTGLLVTQATRGLSEQIQEDHRLLAAAVARDVADYVELHLAATEVIAAQPNLFELGTGAQRAIVRPFFEAYPELTSLNLYDDEGVGLLRSDDGPLFPVVGRPWFEEVRFTREPVLDVDVSQALGRPLFYVAYPALGPDGALRGVVAATLESSRLAELLASSGVAGQVYLVDERGRLLVHSAGRLEELSQDLSSAPPVAAFLRDGDGSLTYDVGTDRRLVGHARVPDLGWGVIVERSQSVALAALLRWRGASFALLVAVIAAAVAVGIVIARRLAAPLARLAFAADALAMGDQASPLPRGTSFELAQLAASFGRMRDRLSERTAELQEERDFSERLINSLPGIVFVVDRRGTLTRWNEGLERLLGLPPEAIGRLDPLGVVAEADRAAAAAALERVFRTGHASTECRLRVADGELRPYHLSGTRLIIGGEPHLVGVGIDIRDRVRAEEEVLRLNVSLEERVRERTAALEAANGELESSNHELEAFTYSVSHDLRAPLRGIDGFAYALEEDEGHRLGEAGRAYVRRIRSGAARMGQLIDDLLQLSRLQRSPLHLRSVSLGAIAEEVIEELRGSEPEREVEVTIRPDLIAVADRGLVRIVLENLLSNAWKFTRERPRARIEVGRETRDGEEVFFVRDDGAGFDPRYADKLFAPFGRLHRHDEFEGNGVGLATVHRIVRRHGGRVWGEGEVGRGATFYFTLPPPA